MPLERFELALDGGGSGALKLATGADLCKGAAPAIGGDFVAHSGARASRRVPVKVASCGPRATLRLSRGLRATGDGRRIRAKLSGNGVLTVRSPKGAAKVVVKARRGAFRASRWLRKRLRDEPRLAFRLRVTDTGKTATSETLNLRGRR